MFYEEKETIRISKSIALHLKFSSYYITILYY